MNTESSNICGICREEGSKVDFETRCSHHFHKSCIESWFEKGNKTCPYCTREISNSAVLERVFSEQNYEFIISLSEKEKMEIFLYSIAEKNMKLFMFLVEHFESTKYKNFQGWNLFHQACEAKNMEVFDTLYKIGVDVNEEDENGKCPVHLACEKGFIDILDKLIGLGADVNCEDEDGKTSLRKAFDYGYFDIFDKLIEAGANIYCKDKCGYTLLHAACFNGNFDIFDKLIKLRADVNSEDKFGSTPLHEACKKGYADIFDKLIELGAEVNVKDEYGKTPLHEACRYGHLYIFNKLIEFGADINSEDLKEARENGNFDIFDKLIELGADNPYYIGESENEEETEADLDAGFGCNNLLRYLAYNNVGFITCRRQLDVSSSSETEATIYNYDIEFKDSSVHQPVRFSEEIAYSLASLHDKGAIFASQGVGACLHFESFERSTESWTLAMPLGTEPIRNFLFIFLVNLLLFLIFVVVGINSNCIYCVNSRGIMNIYSLNGQYRSSSICPGRPDSLFCSENEVILFISDSEGLSMLTLDSLTGLVIGSGRTRQNINIIETML
jgi:hypothetical protein